MSIFSKLFGKKPEEEAAAGEGAEELTEIQTQQEPVSTVNVMIEKLTMLADSDRIIKKVRSGNIVIARIKDMREQNVDELKHAISKIRTSVTMWNGDIAGVGEEWLIVTPSTAKIQRTQ